MSRRATFVRAALAVGIAGTFLWCSGAAAQPAGGAKPQTSPTAAELVKLLEGKKHPFLLFTDIKKTPGYRNRAKAPWSYRR